MLLKKTPLLLAVLVQFIMVASANAAIIAATDFDERTLTAVNIANDTATNLKWMTNGIADPGDMTALSAGTNPLAIFDGTPTTQTLFAPALNVGNGNTFWTTTVALTVLAGSDVTLTDVTFDYWAINGGQAQNVDRRSDFTITLLDPSDVVVDAVSHEDVMSGTTAGVAEVSAVFSTPIALTAPGTYTLQIKGGDYVGYNETGNHAGIDNLSINGTVPEPTSLVLAGLGLLGVISRRRKTR